MGLFHVLDQVVHTEVVKAHPVDQPFGLDQAEQTRLLIARLRAWRDGADLNRAEPHRTQRIDALSVFVESCCETQRIFKGQPHTLHRLIHHFLAH